LVLALFLISACSQVKGVKTEQKEVASEEVSGYDKFKEPDQPVMATYRGCCKTGDKVNDVGRCAESSIYSGVTGIFSCDSYRKECAGKFYMVFLSDQC
jgi:hypothetical protein